MEKERIETIEHLLTGLVKKDFEIIFEEIIAPLYLFSTQNPYEKSKYKLINRQTGEEFTKHYEI